MSKSDDKTDFTAYSEDFSNKFNTSEDALKNNDQRYALHVDPRLNDQSEYSQVGGKRINNQPYPSLGNQQNPNQGQGQDQPPIEGQGIYQPLDGQNNYSQPYDQFNSGYSQPGSQYPDNSYQQSQYNHPGGSGNNYPDQYNSGNYGYPDQNYSQPGYQAPQGEGQDFGNYPSPYNQQNQYSYPSDNVAGNEAYDPYQENNYTQPLDQQGYYDQQQQDDAYFEGDYAEQDYQEQPKRKSSIPAIFLTLFFLVGIGGGLVFAYNKNMLPFLKKGASSSSPIFISKDTAPHKVRPEQPGGKDFPNRGKLIYGPFERQIQYNTVRPGKNCPTTGKTCRAK